MSSYIEVQVGTPSSLVEVRYMLVERLESGKEIRRPLSVWEWSEALRDESMPVVRAKAA